MSPETCSTRRLITKLAPTRIAIPTVCSVTTVGYAQMDDEPRNQSVKALSCRLKEPHSAYFFSRRLSAARCRDTAACRPVGSL